MKNSPALAPIILFVIVFAAGQAYPATSEHEPAQLHKHHKELSLKHRPPVHPSRTARNHKTPAIKRRPLAAKDELTRPKTSKGSARVVERAAAAAQAGGREAGRSRTKRNNSPQQLAQKFIVDRERSASPTLWAGSRSAMNWALTLSGKPRPVGGELHKEEIKGLNKGERKRLTPGSTPKLREEAEKNPIVLDDRPFKPWKNEEERAMLTRVARSFVGAPYKYGGESVRGLDCSAFVKKMYAIFQVNLPRCAKEQYYAGTRVDKKNLATGDLVFFRAKPAACYPSHVGIYLGGDMFIHASSLSLRGVKIDHLSRAYFARTYMGAVRVKAPPVKEVDGR